MRASSTPQHSSAASKCSAPHTRASPFARMLQQPCPGCKLSTQAGTRSSSACPLDGCNAKEGALRIQARDTAGAPRQHHKRIAAAGLLSHATDVSRITSSLGRVWVAASISRASGDAAPRCCKNSEHVPANPASSWLCSRQPPLKKYTDTRNAGMQQWGSAKASTCLNKLKEEHRTQVVIG